MALPAQIRSFYDLADNPGDDGTFHGLASGDTDAGGGIGVWNSVPFFFTGPSIYMFGVGSRDQGDTPPGGKPWMRAWKSTDGGETWTNVDTADEFAVSGSFAGGSVGAGFCKHPIGGTGVAVFYQAEDSTLTCNIFDLTSDTWLGPSTGGPLVEPADPDLGGFNLRAVPLTDGSYLVSYIKNPGFVPSIIVFSGGWGSPETTVPNPATAMCPDNVAGAFIFYGDGGIGTNIVYRDSGGVYGTVTNLPNFSSQINTAPVLVGTNLFILGLQLGTLSVGVADATLPSGTLTFTFTTLSETSFTPGGMAVVNDGTNHPVVTWIDITGLVMSYSIDGVGDDWTAPTEITTSLLLPVPPSGQFADTEAGTGRAGFIYYGAAADTNAFTYYGEFSLAPIPVPPTLVSTSAPNGQQDTPYSFQVEATGDAPLVYFVISGALPPGLTLDAETGLISGTPTMVGSFYFQLQVSGPVNPPAIGPFTINIGPPGGGPWHPQPPWDINEACAKGGAFGLRRVGDGIIGDSSTTSDQFIDVIPGQNWFIEFFVRGSETADGTISYGFDWYDVDGNVISSSLIDASGPPVTSDDGWLLYIGTIVAPIGAVQASPRIQAVDHLNGVWCVNALFSAAQDEYFTLSSIKHYYTEYTLYR